MDNTTIIKSMADLIGQFKEDEKKKVVAYFEMGKQLCLMQTHLTIRQIGLITGLNYVDLSLAKTLAKKFNHDVIEFVNYCENDLKSYKWTKIKNSIKKATVKSSTILSEQENLYVQVVRLLNKIAKLSNKEQLEMHEELNKIKSLINKTIPNTASISDLNYIKYSDCCCCGEYNPPIDGYNLQYFSEPELMRVAFPVCDKCLASKSTPNVSSVMKLYAAYALELEDAFTGLTQ